MAKQQTAQARQVAAVQSYTMDSLEAIKTRFIDLTDPKTFKKEASFALQAISKSGGLQKCKGSTVLESILNVAQIGLTLNPVQKQAYLIPRWDSFLKTNVCILEPSYQGLVKLITDTGSCSKIWSHAVYEGDIFEVDLGLENTLKHVPKYQTKNLTHVYAIAKLFDGTHQIEVMDRETIEDVRATSESYKYYVKQKEKGTTVSCVWVTWFDEMARKAVIRRLCKHLPKTERWDKLSTAIGLQELDYQASFDQLSFAQSLAHNAAIDPDEQDAIFNELGQGISSERCSEIINYLQENQRESENLSPGDVTRQAQQRIEADNVKEGGEDGAE